MGDTPDPFGYCGEYLDSESGLIYLRNRYYDTTSGRFITQDPVKDGLNWYVYCSNNPINRIDFNGLADVPDDGIRSYITLIANITELMDNQINYCNTQVPDPQSSDLAYYKSQANKVREKIKNNPALEKSPQLRKLVNDIVCDEISPSLQKISSVLAVVDEIADRIISGNIHSGELVMEERDVEWLYNFLDKSDKVYFSGRGYVEYRMSAETLMGNLLCNGMVYCDGFFGCAGGWDIRGIYYDVINLDKKGFTKEPFEHENIEYRNRSKW